MNIFDVGEVVKSFDPVWYFDAEVAVAATYKWHIFTTLILCCFLSNCDERSVMAVVVEKTGIATAAVELRVCFRVCSDPNGQNNNSRMLRAPDVAVVGNIW